eukprot:gene10523-biopygen4783
MWGDGYSMWPSPSPKGTRSGGGAQGWHHNMVSGLSVRKRQKEPQRAFCRFCHFWRGLHRGTVLVGVPGSCRGRK